MEKAVKFMKSKFGKFGIFLMLAMFATAAFATTGGGSVTVDPTAIVADVQAQMGTIITAGAGLLGIGIVASVGWRYAKRFLRG